MKIREFQRRHARWLNVQGAILMVILQRAPLINVTLAAEQIALRAPVGALIRTIVSLAAGLGAVNTVVGATPLVPSEGNANGTTVTVGSPVSIFFTVNGTQTAPMSWSVTGNFPPGLNFSGRTSNGKVNIELLNLSGTPTTAGTFSVTIQAFEFANGGGTPSPEYPYTITVNPGVSVAAPSFTQQPASQSVTVGNSVTFNAAADGNPAPTFQWKKGGNNIGGATGSSFSIALVSSGDAGDYTVVATNSQGSVTSNTATLTVTAALAAPSFSQQPTSQSVVAGQGVTFTAAASGNPSPTFQWRKGGNNIGGATGSSYSIGSVTVGDAGDYTVVATNSQGSVTSNPATLSVDPGLAPPNFTLQPATQTVTVGTTLTLTATASGNPAPTYQWRKDDVDIGGATASTFSIPSVTSGDAGSYTVVATNSQGTVTSNAATVTIGKAVPTITWTVPAYVTDGAALGATELSATASVPGTFTYNPPAGTVLPLGMHDIAVTFTPTDTDNYANAMATRTLAVAPARPSTFDANGYLVNNPDVAAGIGNPPDRLDQAWRHYYFFGIFEGRTDGDFNVTAYLAQYPNLQAQFGNDLQSAARHWYTTGRMNGDRIPAGFDVNGYFARNQDIAGYFPNDKYGAWLHYFNFGLFEGRTFDANFIPAEYLELNLDIKAASGGNLQSAVMHWLTWGHPVEDRMGRVPIGFNIDNYLARYPDLAAGFANITPLAVRNVAVWNHYIAYGTLEGRSDGDFEAYNYLATNPDLAAVFGSDIRGAALHWFFYGRREGRRIPGGFNVQNYRALYPDLVVFGGDDLYGSWIHYRDVGVLEGRYYDDTFRPADYLALNPDIAAIVGNNYRDALLHWLYYGQFEGRQAKF